MIAITNGKVVTITQGTFDNGTVLVEDEMCIRDRYQG